MCWREGGGGGGVELEWRVATAELIFFRGKRLLLPRRRLPGWIPSSLRMG
jgi:hypothetical protein